MPGLSFIDTNVWIYAHLRKAGDPRHGRALALISNETGAVISPQVTAEYYSVMLKSGQPDQWIQQNLSMMLSHYRLQSIDKGVLEKAWQIRNRYGFSIWDCQILAAALQAGCDTLYSEDLQHGQQIDTLQILNPVRPD